MPCSSLTLSFRSVWGLLTGAAPDCVYICRLAAAGLERPTCIVHRIHYWVRCACFPHWVSLRLHLQSRLHGPQCRRHRAGLPREGRESDLDSGLAVGHCLGNKMSSRKPEVRLVASNTHGRGLGGLSKALATDFGSGDCSSSVSSVDESGRGFHGTESPRSPSFYKSAQW